jgi:hypothetical protein
LVNRSSARHAQAKAGKMDEFGCWGRGRLLRIVASKLGKPKEVSRHHQVLSAASHLPARPLHC